MMKALRGSVLLSLASFGIALPLGSGPRRPDLSGVWLLNQERSSVSKGFRQGPGGGGGGGATRGGAGGSGVLESGVWIAPALGELLRPKTQLEITQTDTLVTVKDDAGWLRYLVLTGQTMREELGQGGPAIVVSKWEGGRLVTERSLGGEATYREVYRLEKPGVLRLDVEFRSARMPKPFRMRLEYDRSKAVNRE